MPSKRSKLMRINLQQFKRSVNLLDLGKLPPLARQTINWGGEIVIPAARGTRIRKLDVNGIPAEWIDLKDPPAARRVIYFLHGGGYCLCGPSTHRGMVSRIARAAGLPALLIDYRLAPENPFPAALEDAISGYDWLMAQGYKPEDVVVAGDSAGGGLSLALCFTLRDQGRPLPPTLVLLSPWIDLTGSGESVRANAEIDPFLDAKGVFPLARYYASEDQLTNPLVSPLFGDFHGFPPTFIQCAADEILLSDSTRLAEKMKSAGVDVDIEIWKDMWHVFQAFVPYVPEGYRAIGKIGEYIREKLPL